MRGLTFRAAEDVIVPHYGDPSTSVKKALELLRNAIAAHRGEIGRSSFAYVLMGAVNVYLKGKKHRTLDTSSRRGEIEFFARLDEVCHRISMYGSQTRQEKDRLRDFFYSTGIGLNNI